MQAAFLKRLSCRRLLRAVAATVAAGLLLALPACRRGESPEKNPPPTARADLRTGVAQQSGDEPAPPPVRPSQAQGPSEYELVQRIIRESSTDDEKIPAEFAVIIRGLLAAQAGLEFDLDGRLIGVDLAGERRSGGDEEISLAVRLPHLKRFRIAGFGVTPEGVKHLVTANHLEELALENTQIDDAALESLKALPRLWSLNLRRSVKLSDRAVEILVEFPRLTHLYLLENQFSAGALAKLAKMDRLRLLDLRSCGAVNAELLNQLSSMERLVALRLRGYNVDDECLRAVGKFSHLTSLTLEESPAGNAGLAALERLGLESVTLFRCNAINDAGLRIVSSWKTLRSLVLRDMAVRGEFFAELATLPQLRSISVIQTMVSDEALPHLVACQQLEELGLGQTLVTDHGLEVISRLVNLKRLDLSQTSVSDEGLARLANLKELEWLDISGNVGITDASIKVLQDLPKLKEVFLDGTSMTQEGIAQLGPRARSTLALGEER